MRKRTFVMLMLFLPGLFLYSCHSEEHEAPEIQIDREPILLSAGTGLEVDVKSTSATFPNEGKIALIAAEYNNGSPDWTTYPDIQDVAATVISAENGKYTFRWAQQKYWPMEGEELVFLAYSPQVYSSSALQLSADNTSLEITLQQDTPDVLYADKNGQRGNYTKNNQTTVDLGQFQHALTQLTLKVVALPEMNTNIRLADLHVKTKNQKGTLNLLGGNIILGTQENFTIKVEDNKEINFTEKDYEKQVLVLPDTEDDTFIYIKLRDGGITAEFTFSMNQFEKDNVDIIYQQGHNVELIIHVKGTLVTDDPNQTISLYGSLSEWVDKGDYEIEIK